MIADNLKKIIMYFFWIFPVKNNKVFISNYYGKGFGDNAKYICLELMKNNRELDIVWAVNDLKEEMPKEIRIVKNKSIKYFYELATAKVWIDNCRKYFYIKKRKNQIYIQTWHGDVGMKKCEADAIASLDEKYIESAQNDSRMIDYFIAGNRMMLEYIKDYFWYRGKILKIGSPRRDIFYSNQIEKSIQIRQKIGIDVDVKIFLYAPTFRNINSEESLKVYNLDWNGVKKTLEEKFGGTWIGLIRLHPNLSNYYEKLEIPSNIINVNDYPDMQELLLISDCCISDYSSALFEFAVTNKMGFIYAEDLEEYKKDRDLRFSFEQIPFDIANTNKELIDNIKHFDFDEYKHNIKYFFKDINGLYDDGHASQKIAELITNICN